MGAAIGYALLESSSSTYPIFLSLSIGFAFPYILLALKPSLIQKLPKPGNWMNVFKEFMAFPMFATAIWLLWVFSLQVSTNSLIELILIWFLIGILFWLTSKTNNQIIKSVSILIVLISIFAQTININNEIAKTSFDQSKPNDYVLWNQTIEDDLVSSNKSFFINELIFEDLSFNKIFFGSYFKQKSKFDLVYSCPQYIFVSRGRFFNLIKELNICLCVPSNTLPHPKENKVSPVKSASSSLM